MRAPNLSLLPDARRDRLHGRPCLPTLVAGIVLAAAGCRSLPGRGPVPESVANCRTLSQQALTATAQGDWAEAENLLGDAIEACPTNAQARRQYAEVLWRRGDVRGAQAQIESGLRLDAHDPDLQVFAGRFHRAQGDLERALRRAERAIELDGASAEARALRGRVMAARGDAGQALADMQRAVGLAPDDPSLLVAIAELYRDRDQPQRALAALQRAGHLYPPGEEPQQVLYLTGLAYLALDRHQEAVESLMAATHRGQPTAQVLCSLAEAQQRSGQPEQAASQVREALALDPQHGPSRALAARLLVPSDVPRR